MFSIGEVRHLPKGSARARGTRAGFLSGVRHSPGGVAGGVAGWFSWPIQEGFRQRLGSGYDHAGQQLFGRHDKRGKEQVGRLRAGVVVLRMGERFFGCVIVHRAVVFMMVMQDVLVVRHRVGSFSGPHL